MANRIEEQTISLEDMEMIGGENYPILEMDMILSKTQYKVIDVTAKATQWGNRVDYIIESLQGYRYKLSSWNFVTKDKFKAGDILSKNIFLDKFSEKKFRLTLS